MRKAEAAAAWHSDIAPQREEGVPRSGPGGTGKRSQCHLLGLLIELSTLFRELDSAKTPNVKE